jgi:protein SCO1/2
VNRQSKFLYAAVAGLLAALGFVAASKFPHVGGSSGSLAPVALAYGTLIEPRRPMPEFTLLDHHGAAFTRESLKGHWTLLYFGYTSCPDLCPTTLASLASMHKRMLAAREEPRPIVVFVSVDVKRDTPAVLARYVPYFDPAFIGLTAPTQAMVEDFARKLGVAVIIGPESGGSYSVDHSGAVFAIAMDGRLAAILTGPHTADGLHADFRRIVGQRP